MAARRFTQMKGRFVQPGEEKPAESKGLLRAQALQYEAGKDQAPRVVASGQGKIAEQILALARENDVPVYEDPLLAAALSKVDLGREIPPELYLVVAEVLAYLYRVAGMRSSNSA